VASDILMVEGSSSVYANMSTAAAFSKVRENILAGCYWFKDTHGTSDLTGWMRPYAIGAQFPDARLGGCSSYGCCQGQGQCDPLSPTCVSTYDCSSYIFDSCGNNLGSHSTINLHRRLKSGKSYGDDLRTHSIWFRIPLSHIMSSSLPPPSVPVSKGLIAMYTADSWRPAESPAAASWMDLSGAGNHVTDIGGTISVARPVGAPAYVHGDTTAWLRFPEGILPSADYTLFFVARYNGATRRRIFNGVHTNWLSGFHNIEAGVSCHGHCGWISPMVDLHGYDWVMGTDRSNSFRSNGVDRTTYSGSCTAFDRLAINTGLANPAQSDFAVQSVLVYNRKLGDAEVLRVEAWLATLQPAFTPADLQVRIDDFFCLTRI
jgi:hypothetical protein